MTPPNSAETPLAATQSGQAGEDPVLEGTVTELGEGHRSVSDADLAADMQAILTGEAYFDPASGRMISKKKGGGATEGSSSTMSHDSGISHNSSVKESSVDAPTPPQRPTDKPNEQSIFDRIAESMEYANTFNLGDIELEKRFASFDKAAEVPSQRTRRPEAPANRKSSWSPSPPQRTAAPTTQTFSATQAASSSARSSESPLSREDFHRVYDPGVRPLAGRGVGLDAATHTRSVAAERSLAMFDTGEHVISGTISAAPSALNIAGVSFTYGDIISMGDFYATPDQMLNASQQELSGLKTLIDRSTSYYRAPSGPHPVSNEDWDRATSGRYLTLAEENYSHFAPPDTIGDTFAATRADHRAEWQRWHERAIMDSREEHLSSPNATPSLFTPLAINAFADHFLTDAFASGHLVNKELTIGMFRRNFFNGANLTAAGNTFFEQVAAKAFVGQVRERFSELETESYPVCAWGWCIPWRPNINSVDRFATLLKEAAKAEPVRIANVAVKALHDHLNTVGVMVTNAAGHAEWRLYGDGHLDTDTRDVMQQAVASSIATLSDPGILASNFDVAAFFNNTWRYTPRPTAAGLAQIRASLQTYTLPTSTTLVDEAARILTEQLDSTINVLLASGRLRRA